MAVSSQDLPSKFKACLEDPRKPEDRNVEGYNDMIRSNVIAYTYSTGKSVALRYLFEGADMVAAQLDHDYLEVPFLELWIEKSLEVNMN